MITDKPKPNEIPTGGDKIVYKLLLADIAKRVQDGHAKYGRYLETFNGLDSLQMAYDEMLDHVFYLKQYLEEKKTFNRMIRDYAKRVPVDFTVFDMGEPTWREIYQIINKKLIKLVNSKKIW